MNERVLAARNSYRARWTKDLRDRIAEDLARAHVPSGSTMAEPLFLDARTVARVHEATRALWIALEALYERVRSDPEARSRLAIPPMLEAIFFLEAAAPPPLFIGRADALIVDEGPRFLEWNPLPTDVLGIQNLARAFERPLAELGFRPESLALAEHARGSVTRIGRALGLAGEPVIGVVDEPGIDGADSLGALLAHAGARVVLSTADKASLRDGRLALGGEVVDLVHIEDWSFIRGFDLSHPIIQALGGGSVLLLNGGARNVALGMKSAFALLSDPAAEGLLPHEALRATAGTIPWTRLVADVTTTYRGESIDLLRFIEQRQESFVLKPVLGASGQDVVLGWHATPGEFRASIELLLERGGVVQERIDAATQPFMDLAGNEAEHVYDISPFVWSDGEVAGYVTRVMGAEGLHNVGRGGSVVPLVIVE